MDVGTIETKIEKWQGIVATLQGAQQAHAQKVSALFKEREPHLLPARAERNDAAIKELHRIDADLAYVQREERHDADALAKAQETLARFKAELPIAERETQRESLCALIKSRVEGKAEARIADLVEQIKSELDSIVSSNEQIASELHFFASGPNKSTLSHHKDVIRSEEKLLVELIAYRLSEAFARRALGWATIDTYRKMDIRTLAQRTFNDALNAVESAFNR
jgi:hypothetical protein